MSAAAITVALGLPLLLGASVLLRAGVRFRDDPLAFCGWVYPLGALGVAAALFIAMTLRVGATSPLIPLALAAACATLLAGWWRRRQRARSSPPRRIFSRGALAAGLIMMPLCLLPAAYAIAGHLETPVFQDDDASIWGFKAKILYEHGRFDEDLRERLDEKSSGLHHADYPLLNPLLQVWMMARAGRMTEVEVRWTTHLMLVSLILMVLSATWRRAGPLIGSALTLAFAGAPIVRLPAIGAKSDTITALALLGVLDLVTRAAEDRRATPHLPLAAAFAALLVWSKNEGLMLGVVVAIAAALSYGGLLARRAWRSGVSAWLLLPLLVAASQTAFNATYRLHNDLLTGGAGRDPRPLHRMLIENFGDKAGTILAYGWGYVQRFDYQHGLYLLFLGVVLICPLRALKTPRRLVTLTTLGGLAAYFLVYVISFEDLAWHLHTSAARVLLHLLPGMVLLLAMIAGELATAAPGRRGRTPAEPL